MNITVWRHVAVATSRRHLKSGQFKRDYDVVENYADNQTAHTSLIAGNVYARLLEDAPGHVASARQQYRIVSREWHSFLGFNAYLAARNSRLQDSSVSLLNIPSSATLQACKRKFFEEDQENQVPDELIQQMSSEAENQKRARNDLVYQNRLYSYKTKRSGY
jgi:hypothetical protein